MCSAKLSTDLENKRLLHLHWRWMKPYSNCRTVDIHFFLWTKCIVQVKSKHITKLKKRMLTYKSCSDYEAKKSKRTLQFNVRTNIATDVILLGVKLTWGDSKVMGWKGQAPSFREVKGSSTTLSWSERVKHHALREHHITETHSWGQKYCDNILQDCLSSNPLDALSMWHIGGMSLIEHGVGYSSHSYLTCSGVVHFSQMMTA